MSDGARDAHRGFVAALAEPSAPPPPNIAAVQTRRFDIHRNNTVHTMIEALRASFPAVERLVGEAFFAGLARAYLAKHPPRSPLLFRYGGGFAGFIDAFPPAASVPYLSDVARLEWLWLQAYHAADSAPLTVAALGQIAPSALADSQLRLPPSLGLLASRFPVVSLWAASTDRGPSSAVDLARPERACVLRPQLAVDVHDLAPGPFAFIAALADGRPLGAAATDAAQQQDGFDLAASLSALFEIGAVTSIGAASDPNTHQGGYG
ncbi:MAG: DUF2063 domain-containing protein [Pikeienuella sp.]